MTLLSISLYYKAAGLFTNGSFRGLPLKLPKQAISFPLTCASFSPAPP